MDLDWEQEEKGRRARREARERIKQNNVAGKEVNQSQNGTVIHSHKILTISHFRW